MDNLYDILKKNVFSLKAALLCSYDTSHKIFLQRTIHYHMKGQLDIEFVEDQYTEDPKALSQFDLILTNYSELTVPEVPVINISSHPSVDEFGRLIETFNQLMSKKIKDSTFANLCFFIYNFEKTKNSPARMSSLSRGKISNKLNYFT